MNERQKYINDLSIYLRQLADEERNDALEFYDEYIADAGLETRTAIEERLRSEERRVGKECAA